MDDKKALERLIEQILDDDATQGATFSAVGPDGGAVAQTLSDGDYDTHVTLCAAVLGDHVAGLDADSEEFIRDVVREFNDLELDREFGE